jgi:hypothetical protein
MNRQANIVLVIMIVVMIGFCLLVRHVAYRQGQIDAALGHQHYCLKTKTDSTKVWIKIKEGDWQDSLMSSIHRSPMILLSTRETDTMRLVLPKDSTKLKEIYGTFVNAHGHGHVDIWPGTSTDSSKLAIFKHLILIF